MKDRIERKDDKSLYQPKIHSERVKALYHLKLNTGKPMTVLLDQAISELAERYFAQPHSEEEPVLENVSEETWETICELRDVLDKLDYLNCLDDLERINGNE